MTLEKKNNFGLEMSLHKKLNQMCSRFTCEDDFKVRSSRNWESYDKLTGAEKLKVRIQEVQEYKYSQYE